MEKLHAFTHTILLFMLLLTATHQVANIFAVASIITLLMLGFSTRQVELMLNKESWHGRILDPIAPMALGAFVSTLLIMLLGIFSEAQLNPHAVPEYALIIKGLVRFSAIDRVAMWLSIIVLMLIQLSVAIAIASLSLLIRAIAFALLAMRK